MGRWLLIIVGGVVAFIVVANMVADDTKTAFQKSAPAYASVMNNSYSHNTCIVETANRLRATRTDYLAMAEVVCNAAGNR